MPNNDDDNDSRTEPQDQEVETNISVVVGYAFGPKKMKSMGFVMAEASRAEFVMVEAPRAEVISEEDDSCDEHQHFQCLVAPQTVFPVLGIEKSIQSSLTTESLRCLEKASKKSSNLKGFLRHFWSTCSSNGGSVTETASSTPTTCAPIASRPRLSIQISFVPLDPNSPFEDQCGRDLDLILHKLTEDILSCTLGNCDPLARARVERLSQYQRNHPNCCMLDDPKNVMTLMSRSDIAMRLHICLKGVTTANGIVVHAPKYIVIKEDTSQLRKQLSSAGLTLPLIVKPLVAAGTKQSHHMTIAVKESAILNGIPSNSLIQEYVNHNQKLYKVYVMGTRVHVYERASLPNLPADVAEKASTDLVKFDSQHPYPQLKDFGISSCNKSPMTRLMPVTPDEVMPLVVSLKRAFGLELFGFDILISSDHNEWLVVDVNYFPSYKEVPDFPQQLANYLAQRVLRQRCQNMESSYN
ncbi:unnamed protein product [Cylindrotheca closterium]|uniref:ATP-grasp domain-containing protein n=1 Tax=Cylindrotheca closterium TaxID=2856 RepID=A0AAD2JP20_9STRA|nr:unnamed protein product [Cylindrotheca closterium]